MTPSYDRVTSALSRIRRCLQWRDGLFVEGEGVQEAAVGGELIPDHQQSGGREAEVFRLGEEGRCLHVD